MTNLLTPILDDLDYEIDEKLDETISAIQGIVRRQRELLNARIALAQTNILAEFAGVAAVAAPRVYPRAKSKAKKLGRAR
ncbi:MAG TPA: hypothetical protein VER11_34275 [Polyangiaceae bacterium]|nr:hypothetical protein [Polyangiaceae bacterium]